MTSEQFKDSIFLDSKKCNAKLLTIHADGRITVAEHLKPTETAAAVLQIMREQWMDDIQSKKIREQEDRIKRLEEALDKTTKIAARHIQQLENGGDEAIYKTNLFDRESHWTKAKEAKP
jgi:ribosome recycling factor